MSPKLQPGDPTLAREEKFRTMFEEAPVAYHEIDEEGRIRSVNRAECEMLGYAPADLIGRFVWEFMAPEEREASRQSVRRKLSGEKSLAPGRRNYLRRDGQRITVEFHENHIYDNGGAIAGIRTILVNITERALAELAVRESEFRFRSLFENVLEGVYQSTPDGRLLAANPALVRMLGFRSLDDLLQTNVAQDLYLDPRQRVETTAQLEHHGEVRNAELQLRRRDGRVITVLENSRAIFHPGSSEVLYYEGTLTDITDRVEAQLALKAERDFTNAIIDTAGVLLVVLDPTGRIIRFNRAAEQLSGYAAAEAQGRLFCEVVDVAHLPPLQRLIETLASEPGLVRFEAAWLSRSGERHAVTWSTAALFDSTGALSHIIATGVDMTDRRRAEEAMRSSEQRYRELFENANDIIYTHDLKGNFTSINAAAERLTGYTREEALAKNVMDVVAPDYREFVYEQILSKLGGDRTTTYELAVISKEGRRLYLELSTRIQYEDGRPAGVQGIGRDITERKLAADRLQRYAQELRRKNEEMESALAAAREATEAKSRFLATMSHEIRTPMNGVLGMADLLLGTPLGDEQRDYAESVKRSGEALLTVINDILDISRIEAGRLRLESEPFDLQQLVEEVVELLAPRAMAKGLELMCLVDPVAPRVVRGDCGRMRQILLNLLGNAIKFTEQGEVEIRAELAAQTEDAVTLRFEVRDTGIGIPEQWKSKLFQSFIQGDSSMTRRFGGSGLGLAISRQLVEMMGGQISVESAEGSGSTFTFNVVLQRCESDLAAPAANRDKAGLPEIRVLVVDENAAGRAILRGYLASWGCRCEELGDASQVIPLLRQACLEQDPFGAVLLELRGSEPAAIAISRAIEEDPELRRVVRIACARAPLGDGLRLSESGFKGMIPKPIRPSMLYDTLVTAVEGQRRNLRVKRHSPHHQPRRKPEPGRDKVILLAEDNEINQKIVLKVLEKSGYKAEVVATGQEAVEAVRKYPYDLILMDVQMPGMDGFEATRAIRSLNGDAASTPIIAMTANAMAGDRERCLEGGMDDYISKPIRVPELGATLAHWMKK